jgi:hypothetical protein
MCRDHQLADVSAVLCSLDIVFGEVDVDQIAAAPSAAETMLSAISGHQGRNFGNRLGISRLERRNATCGRT